MSTFTSNNTHDADGAKQSPEVVGNNTCVVGGVSPANPVMNAKETTIKDFAKIDTASQKVMSTTHVQTPIANVDVYQDWMEQHLSARRQVTPSKIVKPCSSKRPLQHG